MEHAWEPIARERSGPVRGVVVLLVALLALLVAAGGASAKAGPKAQGENCGKKAIAPAEGCEPATLTIVKDVPGESPTVFPFTVSYRVGGWWWNAESKRKARNGWWPTGPKWISSSFDLSDTGVAGANVKSMEIPLRGGAWVVIRETGVDGWALTDATCTGEWKQGTRAVKIHHRAADGILIRIRHGEDVTCTLTNGTPAPTLHLMKTVVNDNGGTAVAGDFTLTATGTIAGNVLSGAGEAHSTAALKADTFTLSETGPAGYAAGSWVCEGRAWMEDDMTPSSLRKKGKGSNRSSHGELGELKPWAIVNGNQITLAARDVVTCEIANDDIAPSLTVAKVVVKNDTGTATAADFTLTATGAVEGNVVSGAGPVVASGATLKADTFTLSEAGPEGYTATWVCVGGTLTGATIPLTVGQTAACTVTNDDVGPTPPITPVVPETPIAAAVAPAVQPVIAPPATLRGTVRLAGARGCVQPGTVLSRISGENLQTVRFFRDGRLVKSVSVDGTGTRVVTLATRIRAADRKLHTVTARVQFVEGATPASRTVTHRFRNCRQSILPPVIAGVTG